MCDSNVLQLTTNQTFSTCLNQFNKLIVCGKVTGFSNIWSMSVYIPEQSHYNNHSNENLISHLQISTPGYRFQGDVSYTLHFNILYLPSMPMFHVPHNSIHSYILITYLSAKDRALASCCCSTSQPSFDLVNPAQR